MGFIKNMIEQIKKYFDTDLDLQNCVYDFDHADEIVKLKVEDLTYACQRLIINSYHIESYKEIEKEIEKENLIDLIMETRAVDFSKNVARLIKCSRICALFYSAQEKVGEGDIEYLSKKLFEIDQILKYETIKLFNQKRGLKLVWLNNGFVCLDDMDAKNKKDFELIQDIILKNQQILNAIQFERYLDESSIRTSLIVGDMVKNAKYNNFNL